MIEESDTIREIREIHHQAADALVQTMIAVLDKQAPELAKASAILIDRGARLQIVHDMATGSTMLMLVADGKANVLLTIDAEGNARPEGESLQ